MRVPPCVHYTVTIAYACCMLLHEIIKHAIKYHEINICQHIVSGVARPKLMVGPDYRGTKEILEDLTLAAPG